MEAFMGRQQIERLERISYTVPEFMAVSGFSRNKVYRAIASGALRSFKDGKRRMISATAAREFIALREYETAKAAA
jgi:hypothetical protein